MLNIKDHDWVIAPRHTLIPSVYAGIEIASGGFGKADAVRYSGPTYISIRSGKHASSTAYAHALDFNRLLKLPQFHPITRFGADNTVKPVFIFTVDE